MPVDDFEMRATDDGLRAVTAQFGVGVAALLLG
jgi:hypothetical protein